MKAEATRKEFIDKFNAPIIAALNRDNFNYEISGRVKSIYSIWNKMQRKRIPFEEVYDLFAIRIVFKPLPFPSEKTSAGRSTRRSPTSHPQARPAARLDFRCPKANGYEALHSTVMGPDGVWVEVQITQHGGTSPNAGFAATGNTSTPRSRRTRDEFDSGQADRAALSSPRRYDRLWTT